MQELASTAWAFATAGQSDVQLCRSLTRSIEQHVGNFNVPDLRMVLWVVSRHESLEKAWNLLDQATCVSALFSPLCFEALLMECEQRGLSEHEIAVLKGLARAAGISDVEIGFRNFGAATTHMAITPKQLSPTFTHPATIW